MRACVRSFCSAGRRDKTLSKPSKLILDASKLQQDLGIANDQVEKSRETELARYLKNNIRIRGPMAVSQYFRETLTNERYGYYTRKEEIFGKEGDFITAPEISQMFGELIGVWVRQTFLDQAQRASSPSRSFRIAELGPGRGILMNDLLRILRSTKEKGESISVHFIEASPKLRQAQAQRLGCSESAIKLVGDPDTEKSLLAQGFQTSDPSVKAHWNSELKEIPGEDPVYVVAQEFLDALPVNVFEYTERGWREVFIDVNERVGNHHFHYIVSDAPTVASLALERHPKIGLPSTFTPTVGQRIEVSLDRAVVAEEIASVVSQRKGAGLIIDYGTLYPPVNTIRACKKHKFEDILCEPGELDVTSDVDFQNLTRVLNRQLDENDQALVKVFGPITQGAFLKEMGIQSLVLKLLDMAQEDESQVNHITTGYRRLIEADQMGSIYKVIAVAPANTPNLSGFCSPDLLLKKE